MCHEHIFFHKVCVTAQKMIRRGGLGAGLQEQASNHLKLLWSKAMVVSVWGSNLALVQRREGKYKPSRVRSSQPPGSVFPRCKGGIRESSEVKGVCPESDP